AKVLTSPAAAKTGRRERWLGPSLSTPIRRKSCISRKVPRASRTGSDSDERLITFFIWYLFSLLLLSSLVTLLRRVKMNFHFLRIPPFVPDGISSSLYSTDAKYRPYPGTTTAREFHESLVGFSNIWCKSDIDRRPSPTAIRAPTVRRTCLYKKDLPEQETCYRIASTKRIGHLSHVENSNIKIVSMKEGVERLHDSIDGEVVVEYDIDVSSRAKCVNTYGAKNAAK
ncbi:unnamed protein product, partial [Nesidiocoris tenuis]